MSSFKNLCAGSVIAGAAISAYHYSLVGDCRDCAEVMQLGAAGEKATLDLIRNAARAYFTQKETAFSTGDSDVQFVNKAVDLQKALKLLNRKEIIEECTQIAGDPPSCNQYWAGMAIGALLIGVGLSLYYFRSKQPSKSQAFAQRLAPLEIAPRHAGQSLSSSLPSPRSAPLVLQRSLSSGQNRSRPFIPPLNLAALDPRDGEDAPSERSAFASGSASSPASDFSSCSATPAFSAINRSR